MLVAVGIDEGNSVEVTAMRDEPGLVCAEAKGNVVVPECAFKLAFRAYPMQAEGVPIATR